MKKIKAVVYIKLYTDDKKEMKTIEREIKKFCKSYDFKIAATIKAFKDEDNFSNVLEEVESDSEIHLVITKNFNMISRDPKIQYQNYAYLDYFLRCDILTLDMGFEYDFEVKLIPLQKVGEI